MGESTMALRPRAGVGRGEWILLAVAGLVLFGFLGSTELWGKREQRASAEAIDTVDHGRWLVAEIQSRPRLEKPPLPRWVLATLLAATGRREEWVVRLPNALAALVTVGLVYLLGRRAGGRSVGLASGLALASMAFFVVESRQAGNDVPLALWTTLAILAARNRLVGGSSAIPGDEPGPPGWTVVFHGALGLGFLTKGPVILVLVVPTLVGYLASVGRLRAGGRLLVDRRGVALFLLLALMWPVPVLLRDPTAARVWLLEMAQKTSSTGVAHTRSREILVWDWFWMTLPWTPFAVRAVLGPLRRDRSRLASDPTDSPRFDLAWWWAVLNLLILSGWKVAKPSYYVPCLPAVAWLVGTEWVRVGGLARSRARGFVAARGVLQLTWVVLFAAAIVTSVVVGQGRPELLPVALGTAVIVAGCVVGSAVLWRRGSDASSLAALAAGVAAVALVGYGAVAPADNPSRGHHGLARALDAVVPPTVGTISFYAELDEGLWFYLRRHRLEPLAGDRTRYNRGFDLLDESSGNRVESRAERVGRARDQVAAWARTSDPASSFLLIREKVFGLFAADLAGLVEPVHRERDLKRNELVLLRPVDPTVPAVTAQARHGFVR